MLFESSLAEQNDEWLRMIGEYRKKVAENPFDKEAKLNLKSAEFDASEHFYRESEKLKDGGKVEEAINSLQKALSIMPDSEKISLALADCIAARESSNSYKDAIAMMRSGNTGKAAELLEKALELQSTNKIALMEYERLMKDSPANEESLLLPDKTITLKLRDSNVKTVFDRIASACGINVAYDNDAKSLPVSINVKNVSLQKALDMAAVSGRVFYRQTGPAEILVAADTVEKRAQYEAMIIKTYQLNTIRASDMANILKSALNIKKVTINESLNSMLIRDTKAMLSLVDKLVQSNDVKPAEVLFDVEILEVNRTKTEQLGFDYGGRISLALPSKHPAGEIADTAFQDLLRQGLLTLPTFTINFFKQDVDAKMLANPRIRVLQDKKAKIHIGDKVPLRTSIIQDSYGQVRYSYEYKEIGVMLEVTPRINIDNSVNITMRLEVSSLGKNMGTDADPAYPISTRDAETTMLLRDGETAIIGGLIRDDERQAKVKIPGLGDIPAIGGLFTVSVDDEGARTDVLLTITPRIIRGWDYMGKHLREIYSGTENNIMSEPRSSIGKSGTLKNKEANVAGMIYGAGQAEKTAVGATLQQPILSFSEDQYILPYGQDSMIRIYGENLSGMTEIKVILGFNQEYAAFVSAERSSPGIVQDMETNQAQSANGVVELSLKLNHSIDEGGEIELAALRFTGIKQGISYLVFLANKTYDTRGNEVNIQRQTSRLVVK